MAYGDGLENRCRCKTTVGSNPTPSARLKLKKEEMPQTIRLKVRGICVFANGLLTIFWQCSIHSMFFQIIDVFGHVNDISGADFYKSQRADTSY